MDGYGQKDAVSGRFRLRARILAQRYSRARARSHDVATSDGKTHDLLLEIDTELIARGVHKRAGSKVGCPCCVPELHVCKTFPYWRRCRYSYYPDAGYPPYDFVCTEGVWRCTPRLPLPLPSGQLRLDAFSFQPPSATDRHGDATDESLVPQPHNIIFQEDDVDDHLDRFFD